MTNQILPVIKIKKSGQLVCRECKCEGDFYYLEDISCSRQLDPKLDDDGVLHIDGHYDTENLDDGDNARLACGRCGAEYAIPESVSVEFDL